MEATSGGENIVTSTGRAHGLLVGRFESFVLSPQEPPAPPDVQSRGNEGTRMATRPKRVYWAGYLLGLSLGGFFDGILLHQIAADGYFHALVYVISASGLWLL
jgi:hypothetical protein